MALTKQERIRISEKIVSIPTENALAEQLKGDLEVNKVKAEDKDGGHKTLSDDKTALIDGYQDELAKYDGNERTKLVEQDFQDAVDRKLGNFFFLNDPNTPTPNVPSGTWPYFLPYAGNKAVGKTYQEVYSGVVAKEQDKIDVVLSKIIAVEGFSDIQRSSGQHCVTTPTGSCSLPAYDNEADCTLNGGIWTPGTPDESIENYPDMQTAGTELKDAIQDWEDFMNTVDAVVVTTDTDTTRSAENTASKDDISNAISIVGVWQALSDFDTDHGQTTCAGFNGYDVSLLDPTKFRAAELQAIKDELTARQSFITTRISQLEGYLGTVVQDLTTGNITSKSGLYGDRYGIIDLRLNVMIGSLSEVKGYEQAQDAQQQLQNANGNAEDTYGSIMKVALFRAPAAGTNVIHLMDSTDFSIGDTVYIVADEQDEIEAVVEGKDNNTIYLNKEISKKYTRDIRGRIYRLI